MLGVTTNPFAVFYIAIGMILSWLFYIAGNHLGPIPYTRWAGPWIVNSLGIVAAHALPAIGRKSPRSSSASKEIANLRFESGRENFYAFLEGGIQDHIRRCMHRRVVADSKQYDSEAVLIAIQGAFDMERNFSSTIEKEHKDEMKIIEPLLKKGKTPVDPNRKYKAMIRALRLCEYRHLRFYLREAAKGETQ
jgi:hypothetical protein